VLNLVHSVGGLIVNPDFSLGAQATGVTWLLMDWNGWHAVGGIALWATAVVAAFRADYARVFAVLAIGVNVLISAWALIDPNVIGLFYLPNTADVVLHLGAAAIFAVVLLLDARRVRPAAAA
jgi:hypothetical protein